MDVCYISILENTVKNIISASACKTCGNIRDPWIIVSQCNVDRIEEQAYLEYDSNKTQITSKNLINLNQKSVVLMIPRIVGEVKLYSGPFKSYNKLG